MAGSGSEESTVKGDNEVASGGRSQAAANGSKLILSPKSRLSGLGPNSAGVVCLHCAPISVIAVATLLSKSGHERGTARRQLCASCRHWKIARNWTLYIPRKAP